MKITILQEKLKKGLTIVERIAGKSLTFSILNNILLSSEKNFLNLSATDLELGIKWWILSKTEKDGKIVIPAKTLTTFISFLPNQKITLEKKENILYIENENNKSQIKGLNPEDFPIIPEVSREEFFEFQAVPFCQKLTQVVDFASSSQTRPEISGVYFSFKKNEARVVATDSFRLGEKIISPEKTSPHLLEKEVSFILPQKTVKEVINIFGEREGNLKIYFSPNQILFEGQMAETDHPEVNLVSRLIEGEYPDYQEIIPKDFKTQIVLDKGEFLNQIKIASLFSGKINEIKFKIDSKKKGVEISSQNPDLGEHQSFIAGEIKGGGLDISFNHRFLMDGLLNIRTKDVVFSLNDSENPGVLRPVGDSSYTYLLMPIKN
jgi:DNA polymerase III subunit beta